MIVTPRLFQPAALGQRLAASLIQKLLVSHGRVEITFQFNWAQTDGFTCHLREECLI